MNPRRSRSPGRTTRRPHRTRRLPFPVTGGDHPGIPLDIPTNELELGLPLRPFITQHLSYCHTCLRDIAPGDTIFLSSLHTHRHAYRLCWECGTGLMLEHGYYDQADVNGIPPIGGPPTTPPLPSSPRHGPGPGRPP